MALPLDYELQREQLARRRKVAEALMAQSMTPTGGTETVGGVAVRRSPLEGVAKVAQAYTLSNAMKNQDTEARDLGQRYREDVASAISDYQKATTPRAATYDHIIDEQADGGEGRSDTITAPAYNPSVADRRGAALNLMGRVGEPKDAAKAMVAQALVGGTGSFGKVDPKDYTPESVAAFGQTGDHSVLRPRAKYHTVGSNLVAEPDSPAATTRPTYTAPEKDPEAIRTLKAAGLTEGTPEWNAAMTDLINKTTKHAPAPTAVATASTEKGYGSHFAGKVAEQDVAMLDAARKAPDLAERANRMKEVIATGKVITGTGADIRLQVGKALNLAGASDAEKIANTEALTIDMARNTLDAIKASGLGSGTGFSNADRDFLEKAAGGKITLEATTISRLADLSHRAAAKSAEAWSKRVKDIPDSALTGTGIKRDPISVPALFGGGAAPRVSPATQQLLDKYAPVAPGG